MACKANEGLVNLASRTRTCSYACVVSLTIRVTVGSYGFFTAEAEPQSSRLWLPLSLILTELALAVLSHGRA